MKRVLTYAILFPLIAGAFMFSVQRANPLKGDWTLSLVSVYAIGLVPGIVTAWTHDALRHRGYRSIASVFVGAAALSGMVYFFIGLRDPRLLAAYTIAGLFAGLSCWMVSRIGQQKKKSPREDMRE